MEGVDFLVLVLCMAYLMHLDAVKTHTTWLHSHCVIALGSWEARWGFDELSKFIAKCIQHIGHKSGKSQSMLGKLVCISSPQYQACAS